MKSPHASVAAEATAPDARLPKSLVYATLMICALPLALTLFGVDLGSPRAEAGAIPAGPSAGTATASGAPERPGSSIETSDTSPSVTTSPPTTRAETLSEACSLIALASAWRTSGA